MKPYFTPKELQELASFVAPPRGLIARLVVEDLHYCCEFRFFSLYRRASVVAARLGVSVQAVRARRRIFKAGGMGCENCSTCQRPVR